ncbi:MAG: PEP-CTERM sorting domain-containing protein [Verrucomicrobia bacterium]|nr:PEP-CTERM sorting domain-containing protein [Verrucomicrobiota bacterium]
MNHSVKYSLLLLSAAALFSPAHAQGQVIVYQQSFSNNTGSNQTFASYGWFAARSRGASETNANGTSTVFSNNIDAGGAASSAGGATVADINATAPHGTGLSAGFTFSTTDGGNATRFIFSVPTAGMGDWALEGADISKLTSFSWEQRNNSSSARVRALIQVDGQWYASATSFTNASNAIWSPSTLSVLDTTLWHELAVQGNGSPSGMNTSTSIATSDLSGQVTALGLYAWSPSGQTVRFDTFSVVAIPEPSTYAAIFGLLVLGVVAYRRRR